MGNNDSSVETFLQWIKASDNIVFFGGAGVSTESGIPDFRSVDGLYNQKYDYPPETILSHTFYRKHPQEFSDLENPLDYYVLGVEGLKLNTDKEPEYIHVPAFANSPFIRQCFENILREMHNKQDRYAEICQHYLDILILYFCRKDHVSYEVVDAQNSSRECHKVKRFIEHNYQSMISLDSLAENCSLSKYYLSHRFAELYGKSPIAYLNEVRLASARDLLLTTNHSIEEIAGCIGFSSTSYFSQSFQKKFHESPQQFRKSHRVRT